MLFSAVFVPVGVLLLLLGWGLHAHAARRAATAEHWPRVPGRVLSSEVSVNAESQHQAQVRYRYTVAGVERTGRRVAFGDAFRHPAPEEAAAVVARHPPGAPLEVRYDPDDPDTAVLDIAPPRPNRVLLAFGAVMIVCGPLLDLLLP